MQKNAKSPLTQPNTYLMAYLYFVYHRSTLMQKLLQNHDPQNNSNADNLVKEIKEQNKNSPQPTPVCNQPPRQPTHDPSHPTTPTPHHPSHPLFSITLQYHPLPPPHPKSKLSSKLATNLFNKPTKKPQQFSYQQSHERQQQQRESKILQRLRRNVVEICNQGVRHSPRRNDQRKRERHVVVFTEGQCGGRTIKRDGRQQLITETIEVQEATKKQENKEGQRELLLGQEERREDKKSTKPTQITQQKSPSKVSVNFQLFYPKQKLRASTNQPKHSTRHSLATKQRDIFRIKKSTKSISLTQQQKSTQLQKPTPLIQNTQRLLCDDIIIGLRKNSALKYIEKVEKYKKYKDSRVGRQMGFGLNIVQAECHGVRGEGEVKTAKEIGGGGNSGKGKLLNGGVMKNNYSGVNNNSSKFFVDTKHQAELTSLNQLIDPSNQTLMNITMSEGVSLALNTHHFLHENDPQSKPQHHQLLTNPQNIQLLSPQKQQKYPSQQKLIPKTFFGPAQLQRKKLLLRSKLQDDSWAKEKGRQRGTFKGKLKSMIESMDVLLNAYCCRIKQRNEEEQKLLTNNSLVNQTLTQMNKEENVISFARDMSLTLSQPSTLPLKRDKFLFFVGNGNNKNLIRSIMKKRGWWMETENIDAANFVWSQLKIKDVLDRQTKMGQKLIEEPDSWYFKSKQEENTILPKTINRNKGTLNNRAQEVQMSQNLSKIFHKQMLPIYTRKVQQKQKQHIYLRPLPPPTLIHNHYDANYMLGNKKALYYNLLEYCSYKKVSLNTIIPLTFHIESTQSKQFKNFMRTAKKFKNALWIVKPGENSNRGNGIFVEKDLEKIRAHVEKNATQKHSFIVQKYLKNIFLYNKRKFDIRVYLLMSTIGGITKFFWYQQGYIRTSSQLYNTEDIRDLFIHLTNDAIQSKNETYSKYQKGNKISYTQFQRYLDLSYKNEGYRVSELVGRMRSVAEKVVRSTYWKIDKGKKVNGFELFGLDFLVDKDFTPWLLEVNTNPCLQLSSPILQRLIPRMVQNMFRLTLDPIYRPNQTLSRHSSYFLYDNVFQTNKFELIFDSLFDSDFEWEEICAKGGNVVYEDEDEVFESNGVEVEVDVGGGVGVGVGE